MTPAALSRATALASTDPNTRLQVSFVLKLRNAGALQAKVAAGWSGRYLSTAQFAAQYGQPASVVSGIEKYLHGFGIRTSAYRDRLDIATTGTAAQYEKALSVGLNDYRVAEADANGAGTHPARIHATKQRPKLPATAQGSSLGNAVLAILGLSNYSPFANTAVRAVTKARPAATGTVPAGELTPADFAKQYNLTGLYAKGAKGQGRTIGIVTLASFDPAVPLAFWNTYLGLHESAKRLTTVTVDGGAGAISATNGSDETDLDVEQSGALAPKANVRVYVAPNTDPGFSDAFYRAASDNIADSVSASWGESETIIAAGVASGTETPAYEAAFDQAFLEFGAQGQSSFASAGDNGAYDAQADAMSTNLAVDTPANSPYITSAGGTTLPGAITIPETDAAGNPTGVTQTAVVPQEIAWSWDYLWPLFSSVGFDSAQSAASSLAVGGGGGYSVDEPRPSYQKGISSYEYRPYLTPTTPKQIAPGVTEPTEFQLTSVPGLGSGVERYGRAEPDISANADPDTGYAVYDPSLFADSDGFAQYGGTSFVAPQFNGSTAVIDSAVGHRVGLWNPKAYSSARGSNSVFHPINGTGLYQGVKYLYQTDATGAKTALSGSFSNNNLYYTGNPSSYWSPAVGLGTPNLTRLATALTR